MESEPNSKTVLYLEDDPVMSAVLRRSLQRAGFRTIWYPSGTDAYENYLNDQFDVIVTDYQMPGLSGEEFVRKLRQSPKHLHVPVIFVTGKGFEIDVESITRELNVYEFLTKPFSPSGLIKSINNCLAQTTDKETAGDSHQELVS